MIKLRVWATTITVLATATVSVTCDAQSTIYAPPTAVPDGFELMDGDKLFVGPGGEVGQSVVAGLGSEVEVTGGTIGLEFRADAGSLVSISGGQVMPGFIVGAGSDVEITGGQFSGSGVEFIGFLAERDSRLSISGGSFGTGPFGSPLFSDGSNVELIGGEFRLDGAEYPANSITTEPGDVFTGTFLDGSVFAFRGLSGVTLTSQALPPINPVPRVIDFPLESGTNGLRPSESLVLLPGGQLPGSFVVIGATLDVEGGEVGFGAEVYDGIVNLSDGVLGPGFSSLPGSVVNISGGTVQAGAFGTAFRASGSVVNISGGVVEDGPFGGGFTAGLGTIVNISGGTVESGAQFGGFQSLDGSVVNIWGGEVQNGLRFERGSQANLFGIEFYLDGIPLESLPIGETYTIEERGVQLSGRLADGTLFQYDLNPVFADGEDLFSPDARLTLTLIPEPHSAALAILAFVAVTLSAACNQRSSFMPGSHSCSIHRTINTVCYAMKIFISALLFSISPGLTAKAVNFDWAIVGNPGNPPDVETGYGAVDYRYRISRTEVTNSDYVEFLNAVDPSGANSLSLYHPLMSNNARGGIDRNTTSPAGRMYQIRAGRQDNPVVLVSILDAMRFVNWLHNGQGSGSTEAGAYLIGNGLTETRSASARYFIPSEDEWYKAAYHKNNGATGDYWNYPTSSDLAPFSEQPSGTDSSDSNNQANYYKDDGLANDYDDGYALTGGADFDQRVNYLADVGSYPDSTSPYGTFDQGGNVAEWNEAVIQNPWTFFAHRGLRGGSWATSPPSSLWPDALSASSRFVGDGFVFEESTDIGFRVAAVIPEPPTLLLGGVACAGMAFAHRRVPLAAPVRKWGRA